jgi:hypothetical protein
VGRRGGCVHNHVAELRPGPSQEDLAGSPGFGADLTMLLAAREGIELEAVDPLMLGGELLLT